jgi:alpha-galactosidase
VSLTRDWILRSLVTGITISAYLYVFPNLVRGLLASYSLPEVKSLHQEWGVLQFNQSISQAPLLINGSRFWTGLGTHASSIIQVTVPPFAKRFSGACGLDDNSGGRGEFSCKVQVNRNELWKSGTINKKNPIENFSIFVAESDVVLLVTEALPKGIDFAHANWVELHFEGGARN